MGTASRESPADQPSDIGDGPVLQWSEQNVANHTIDRRLLREIQDVDKVVPARVQEE